MDQNTNKSPYKYGADLGLWMGLYLMLISACFLLSMRLTGLAMFAFPLMIGVPVVLYFMLRRIYKESPINRTLSALWMSGIMTFICGSLICGILTAGWLLIFQPNFFYEYVAGAIRLLQEGSGASQYATQIGLMQEMIDKKLLPTPMEFVVSMIWTTAFLGSLTSLVVAWMVRLTAGGGSNNNNLSASIFK